MKRIRKTGHAVANHRIVRTAGKVDRFYGACWGAGAGPFDYGLFAAVGARFALSPDGENWYEYLFDLFGGLTEVTFRDNAHGGAGAFGSRVFAVCGYYDAGGTDRPIIMTVPDAADANGNPLVPEVVSAAFTGRYSPSDVAGMLRSIAWSGSVFCAVSDGGLIVTQRSNLATATVRTPGSSYAGDFHQVFASGSLLIACGENGEVQHSADNCATWTRQHSDSSLGTLRSGVPYVVGCSDENKILRSSNGELT